MKKAKVIERIFDPYLKKSLNGPLITVIIGPRQSGKTTSVNIFLDDIPTDRKFYLNLDSLFERDRVRNDENYLQDRIEETSGSGLNRLKDKFYLFIDEAQKLPLIFELIKILYDKYSPELKIIVSGSSSLELLDKTAETLAGRVRILRIYPFSMSEASRYKEIGGFECARTLYKDIFSGSLSRKRLSRLIREFKPESRKKMQLINELITRSLFPPTFSRIDEDDIPRWLVDYIGTYIEKDMHSVCLRLFL
ncbi:MAG: AAA family ATPase [Spirochaetes bacterium]|nr:AAA family ATPase [Spirochaetota bacterium]